MPLLQVAGASSFNLLTILIITASVFFIALLLLLMKRRRRIWQFLYDRRDYHRPIRSGRTTWNTTATTILSRREQFQRPLFLLQHGFPELVWIYNNFPTHYNARARDMWARRSGTLQLEQGSPPRANNVGQRAATEPGVLTGTNVGAERVEIPLPTAPPTALL